MYKSEDLIFPYGSILNFQLLIFGILKKKEILQSTHRSLVPITVSTLFLILSSHIIQRVKYL